MIGAIKKVTNSSFQKCMTFCRSIYMNKVMKLLAFIFEQPSYSVRFLIHLIRSNIKLYSLLVDSDAPIQVHLVALFY